MARRNLFANPDTREELVLPFDQAVARIKASRNRKIFIMARLHAPATIDPENKYFSLLCSITVTAPAAIKYLADAYGTRFKTDALVTLHIHQSTMFVG